MAEELSIELNNGVFTPICDESEAGSYHFSPDVDSKCLSSKTDKRDSGVTSDLDRAVAALEARSSNLLEHSKTTCLSSEQELKCRDVEQDASAQGGIVTAQQQDDGETKPRGFSELRAMFSQTDSSHNMISPRKGKLRDLNSPKIRPLDSGSIEHEKLSINDVTNEMESEGDSMVARMKRNFETTTSFIDTSIEKSPCVYKKPVSFEVGLDDYVTCDSSSIDITHDPSQAQQIKKEVENIFSENVISPESYNTSIVTSSCVENLEQNNEQIKEKEILPSTGIPSDSPKSLSFDISFDDKPSKRVPPKTMPKLPKRKLIDSKTAEVPSSGSETQIKLVDEQKQTLEIQGELKDFSTSETSTINRSYSFEVSFEDDSPRKMKSHDRLNKLLVKKPCRTADRPPGEDITVCCLATCENEQNGNVQDKTNNTDNELLVMSPKEQLSSELGRSASVGFDKDRTAETNRELALSTENGKTNERDEMEKTAQAISFDICFDEDSIEKPKLNRKPKLTPKHIRLKQTKEEQQQQQQQQQQPQQQKQHQPQQQQKQQEQQQQNTQSKIETDEVNNSTSSFSLSFLPKTSRPDLKEPNERNTYTLDEVSSSLTSACERGLTLEDALDDLAKQQETTEQPGSTDVTLESDDVTSTKRGTYSLDEVATCLVSAADKGLTVAEALDNLAKSEEKEKQIRQSYQQDEQDQSSITNTSLKRGTYDLDEVSKKIDDEKDNGSSLEEALIQLLDEVETVVKETQKTSSRGTYDLKDVSEAVEQASELGIPVEETLEKIATIDDTKTTDRAQLTPTVHEKQTIPKGEEESRELNSRTEIIAGNRGTYSLDDVEKQLEQAADKGSSVVDTLSEISKPRVPDTNISLKINGKESAKIEETVPPTRNTYTLDEVAESLELAKSKGIPIVEALSNISTERFAEKPAKPGSRETYTLDKVAQSLETAKEKGLPIVMALENLVLNGGGSLRGPAEVAVYRRQGKLTNRKTYALASPLETIGEEKQLRLFDGTTRKLLPPTKDYLKGTQPQLYDDPENTQPSGQNVVQTLDLLTSACEALLKTTGKKKESDAIEEEQTTKALVPFVESCELGEQFKAESRDSGISFPGGPSERGTYSLDEVSATLEGATKKGIPVIDALGSLTKEPVKKYRIPRALRKAGSKSESSLNRLTTAKQENARQTYSLDNVSNSMEDAKAKGIPVIAALDELTNSLARFSATRPTPGKPIRKPERPSITRKREAARQERANVRSEVGREAQKPTGSSFPISYPPAMRNSYSLDDVASAFEKAYQTGIPFQDVLEGIHSESGDSVQPGEDTAITRSTGSLKIGKGYLQSTTASGDYSRKTQSASSLTKVNEFSIPAESNSSLDGKSSSPPRKSSTSSEGSLTCSSSYGSDVSVNRDSSPTEELPHVSKVSSVRRQRKRSNGPFQLKKGSRRNSPANLKQLNTSPSPLHGDSVESLASRDSEQSDSSQTKRGTYDLKKIGEELDRFRVEGIPVVQGLDKLGTDVGTVGKAKSEGSINIQVTPKRGTYSLDDVSQQLDSEQKKGDSVIRVLDTLSTKPAESQSNSQPSASENKTRSTFTLDHVDVSIADAARRGVPVVEVLDKLSHEEISGELQKTEKSKRDHEPFAKTVGNSFFVEYFPSKTEEEAQKSRIENGAPVHVREGPVWEHRDLDNYPTRDGSAKQKGDEIMPSDFNIIDVIQGAGTDKTHFKERTQLISIPITTSDVPELRKSELRSSECDSQILSHSRVAEQTPLEIESKGEDQTQVSPEQKSNADEVAGTRTRPRWQRSGSYVEALESFEELLTSDQDLSSPEALDSIPVKESDYLNGNYDTMYPERASSETSNTSPRGRSTWRPSGSVLDEILNLMDEHEEQGLSIADALEKAAEFSEQQGGSVDSKTIDAKEDGAHRGGVEETTVDLDLNRDEGKKDEVKELPHNKGTLSSIDYSYHGNPLQGYQAESSHHLITTQQDNVPLQRELANNGPIHCWEIAKPTVPPTVPPSVVDTAPYKCHVPQADVTIHEDEDPSSKKVFSVFISDEPALTNEGLTPEQQKKRDRFLRNRQKKMEEEKARKESELEKKRQREVRQQEIEVQKRVRQFHQPEEHSRFTDHTSPPRIIKSSGKSNRKMITNALSHACLSGAVNNENRERCLQAMSDSQGSHFIILLKDGLRFRGLFVYSIENEQAYRIYGTGPKIISSNMVDCVYKYNSGNKDFIKIPSKTLSISVDGVAINKVYWQTNKPNVASKTQSNLKRPSRPSQR